MKLFPSVFQPRPISSLTPPPSPPPTTPILLPLPPFPVNLYRYIWSKDWLIPTFRRKCTLRKTVLQLHILSYTPALKEIPWSNTHAASFVFDWLASHPFPFPILLPLPLFRVPYLFPRCYMQSFRSSVVTFETVKQPIHEMLCASKFCRCSFIYLFIFSRIFKFFFPISLFLHNCCSC